MEEMWLLHPGCSYLQVGGSEDHLGLQLSNKVLSPWPSRTHLQGDGIYGLTDGAKPPTTEPAAQPHIPSCLSHLWSRPREAAELHTSVTSTAVGTQGWLGCSPHRWPWGSLPNTSPACLSPTSSGVSAGSCWHGHAQELTRTSVCCLPDYSVQPGHTLAGSERWDKAKSV